MGKQRIYFIFYPFSLNHFLIYRIFCFKLLHFYFLYEVLLFMKHHYCHWLTSCFHTICSISTCPVVTWSKLVKEGASDSSIFKGKKCQNTGMPEAGFLQGRTFNYMTFVEQRHASDRSSGATIIFVSVGMMSNTWVLIIAGRQAKRPDIRYRSNE